MASLPPIQSLIKEHLLDSEGNLDSERLLYGLNQFMGSVHGALNKGITLSDNTTCRVVHGVKLNVPDYPWTSVADASLENSYQNYGSPWSDLHYMVWPGGDVEISGMIKRASAATSTIFTMPEGYRPRVYQGFSTIDNGTAVDLRVHTTGAISQANGPSQQLAVNVRYRASSAAAPKPFAWTETPIVKHGLPRCSGLTPVACRVVGEDERTATCGDFALDWRDKGDGQLVIRSAYGLQPGKRYELSLLCLSE